MKQIQINIKSAFHNSTRLFISILSHLNFVSKYHKGVRPWSLTLTIAFPGIKIKEKKCLI